MTAGSKSYIFQGKLNGNVIRMTLGDIETMSLAEARDRAAQLRVQIREGCDPRQVKADVTAADASKRAKAQSGKAPAMDAWCEYVDIRRSAWGTRYLEQHEYMMAKGGEDKALHCTPGLYLFACLSELVHGTQGI